MTTLYNPNQKPLVMAVPDVLDQPHLDLLAKGMPSHLQGVPDNGSENWDGSYRTPFLGIRLDNGVWTVSGDTHIRTGNYKPALEKAFLKFRQSIGIGGDFSGLYQFVSYPLSRNHLTEDVWHTDHNGQGYSMMLPLSEREGNWSGGDLEVRVGQKGEGKVLTDARNQGIIVYNPEVQHRLTRMQAIRDDAVRNVLLLWFS